MFRRTIVFFVLSAFLVNTTAQACPFNSHLNVQTIFKPIDPTQMHDIRDKGIIKYYLHCLAETFKNLDAVPGDMRTSIGKEKIQVILTFSPKKRAKFAYLLKDQKKEHIVPSSINGMLYYAYVTISEKSKSLDITVFTEKEFSNKIKSGFISHGKITRQKAGMIAHEEKIDTALTAVHGIEGMARDVPPQIKESVLKFFKDFGVGERFLNECGKFITEGRVKIVPYRAVQNVVIEKKERQIPIKIDTAHASDNYINIPVESTETYVPVMRMLVRELSKKCDGPPFFSQTLAEVFEQWLFDDTPTNLCEKYSEMHEIVKTMKFRDLAKQKGFRRAWPEIYQNGRWIKHCKGGMSAKEFALLDGVTIKKQLSRQGILKLGGKDRARFEGYPDRVVEADIKDGFVTKVRIYKQDPRDGIENKNPDERFEKEIIFSQFVLRKDEHTERIICSWYGTLTKQRFIKLFAQYPRLILKGRLSGAAILNLSGIKSIRFSYRLAGWEIEAEMEEGDIVLLKYVWQKDGHIYKSRVPPISGMRKKIFKKEEEFRDDLAEALFREGIKEEQSKLIADALIKLNEKFLDILVEHKLFTKKIRDAIAELNMSEIDAVYLARQIKDNIQRYGELGYGDRVTRRVTSTTALTLAVLPAGFVEYLGKKYRLYHPSRKILAALKTYNLEAYVRQGKETLSRQGTFDERKHLKLFDPDKAKVLTHNQRKRLLERFKTYSRILDILSKMESKEVQYTNMRQLSEGYGLIFDKNSHEVKIEDITIPSVVVSPEIKKGDILYFKEDRNLNFIVKSIEQRRDGRMSLIIVPEKQKMLKTFSKKGSFVHVSCDNVYAVQREILLTMLNELTASGLKTTGNRVIDKLLKLEVESPDRKIVPKKAIKFCNSEIPRRKVEGEEEDSSGWRGDESYEMAVKHVLSDENISVIHAPVGTGEETVIAEIIMQYAKKRQKKVLLVNPGGYAEKTAKILEKITDKDFPVFKMRDEEVGWQEYDTTLQGSLVVGNIEDIAKVKTETFLKDKKFDVVIMPNSSCTTLTEAFMPLAHLKDEGKLVLVGDSNYLAPLNTLEQRRLLQMYDVLPRHIKSFFRSMLARIIKNEVANEVHLSTNWEQPAELSLLVSKVFNKDRTHSRAWDSSVKGSKHGTGFKIVDISAQTDEVVEREAGEKHKNERSAGETVKLVKQYLKMKIPSREIMIMTLTNAQKEHLRSILSEEYEGDKMPVIANLKDYRGRENQVVIFDFGVMQNLDEVVRELYAAFAHAKRYIALVCDSRMFMEETDKETEQDGPGKEVLGRILKYYIRKMWEFYPEQLTPGMMKYLPKDRIIYKVCPGLIGKYQPLEDVRFIYNPELRRYVAKFLAVNIEEGEDKAEEITLYADAGKLPKTTFGEHRTTGIPEIDEILRQTLAEIPWHQRLLLRYNPYNIDGIGTKDYVAVTGHLKPNRIAKFHEIAHAAIDKQLQESHGRESVLLDYITKELVYQKKRGEEALDAYLELKVKQHNVQTEIKERWKHLWRVHYALKLFQQQKWPQQNKVLNYLEKFYTAALNDDGRKFKPAIIYFSEKKYESDCFSRDMREFLQSQIRGQWGKEINAVILQNLKFTKNVDVTTIAQMIQGRFFKHDVDKYEIRSMLKRVIKRAVIYGNENKKNNIIILRWYEAAKGINLDVIYQGPKRKILSYEYFVDTLRDKKGIRRGQIIHLFLPKRNNPAGERAYVDKRSNKGESYDSKSAAERTISSLKNVLFNAGINCGDNERILLALDTDLGKEGTERFIKEIIRDISDFRDPLGKIIIVADKGERLARKVAEYIESDEDNIKIKEHNVVMVTKYSNKRNCREFHDAIITFVDDREIDFMEYYPLPEVVLFTVAKALYYKNPQTYTKEELVSLYKAFNSEIKEDKKVISLCIDKKVFTVVLEPTVPFEYEDLVRMYKNIQTFWQMP